jgi:Fe-S cluster biosynthesis and repair protein YggX
MARIVHCVKLGRELPGLDKPPFPGPLGRRIYEHVSRPGWALWPAQETILINHYGLSLVDPRAQKFLLDQMEEFFFGENAQMPEGWSPTGQGGAGAPRRKK